MVRCRKLLVIIILVFMLQDVACADPIEDFNSEIDYTKVDDYMQNSTGNSFSDYVQGVLLGKEEFSCLGLLKNIIKSCYKNVFSDMDIYSGIYVLLATSCIFMPMSFACKSSQVKDLSFNLSYLLSISILGNFYLAITAMTGRILTSLIEFMNLFIPAYLMGITFSNGAGTATGLYAVLLFAINISEKFIKGIILPLVSTYFCIAVSNHFTKKAMFSKLSELIGSLIIWGNKLSLSLVVGISSIQSIISPGLDRFKRSTVGEVFNMVPVFGNAFSGVGGTLLGAATVLKNAIGMAGVIAILVLISVPLFKIAFVYLILRLTAALIQPVAGDKLVAVIADVTKSIYLLLKIAVNSSLLFMISLVIIAVGTGL